MPIHNHTKGARLLTSNVFSLPLESDGELTKHSGREWAHKDRVREYEWPREDYCEILFNATPPAQSSLVAGLKRRTSGFTYGKFPVISCQLCPPSVVL